MPRVLIRETLAGEHVAEVSITIAAQNFLAASVGVGLVFYRAGQLIIEGWPSTT